MPQTIPHLLQQIARELKVPYVLLVRIESNSPQLLLSTVYYHDQGKEGKAFSYTPEKAPCRLVYQNGHYFCAKSLMKLFPNDPAIQEMKLDSYFGIRIDGPDGIPWGHLAVFDKKEMSCDKDYLQGYSEKLKKLILQ